MLNITLCALLPVSTSPNGSIKNVVDLLFAYRLCPVFLPVGIMNTELLILRISSSVRAFRAALDCNALSPLFHSVRIMFEREKVNKRIESYLALYHLEENFEHPRFELMLRIRLQAIIHGRSFLIEKNVYFNERDQSPLASIDILPSVEMFLLTSQRIARSYIADRNRRRLSTRGSKASPEAKKSRRK